jgi:predicted aspartyl protease
VGGLDVATLVDSGSSFCNISEELANRIPPQAILARSERKVKVVMADGRDSHSLYMLDVEVHMKNEETGGSHVERLSCHVFEGHESFLILGMDFLQKVALDLKRRAMVWESEQGETVRCLFYAP